MKDPSIPEEQSIGIRIGPWMQGFAKGRYAINALVIMVLILSGVIAIWLLK